MGGGGGAWIDVNVHLSRMVEVHAHTAFIVLPTSH